jgi:transcriptional regulator with XRE-family HTH domain
MKTLKDYRSEHGLTLFEMAEKVGVSEVSMSRYERGRVPRPAILRKIAEVTGGEVGPNSFFLIPAAEHPPAKRKRKKVAPSGERKTAA